MTSTVRFTAVLLLALTTPHALAIAADGDAEVRLPLTSYDALVREREQAQKPRVAPASYALGQARVQVRVEEERQAAVVLDLEVRVAQDGWVAIPILPNGTAISEVEIESEPVALAPLPDGLCWVTDRAGVYAVRLSYRVDAQAFDTGYALPIPLPAASAVTLEATLPLGEAEVSVIPSAGMTATTVGNTTHVTATVPATSAVQIVWSASVRRSPSIARALYRGEIQEGAAAWHATFDVDLFNDEPATIPILPSSTTLQSLRLDDAETPILVESGRIALPVTGRGRHSIQAEFQVPVERKQGPPVVTLQVLPIPISHFIVSLEGKKELRIDPASEVALRFEEDTTEAEAFVPMTEQVTLQWTEALPDADRPQIQSNATIYHWAHPGEGVLDLRAHATFEITRGETNTLALEVPVDVQVNRIESPTGAVIDWRLSDSSDHRRVLDIFLDRQIRGEFRCEVHYDRSIQEGLRLELPLLRARSVQRQRGMVALLAGRELELRPDAAEGATRVGENRLPPFFLEELEHPITHTFKYQDDPPALPVVVAQPERRQGRFDAEVDTLLSVGEVALRGSTIVEVEVKSGSIDALTLTLPSDVNLLPLTGPSIRTHTTEPGEGGHQQIHVRFTQEMEGRFRMELAYERLLSSDRVTIPRATVVGADVEQGRLAVEAISAAEVRATRVENLSPLDVVDLPQQLVLRTTNPILLAYRYAHADPEPRLDLQVTRHRVVDVLEATIDDAFYQTLFTRDGLAVTTADFVVRNSRKQFLRITLPEGSDIWSTFVDGRPEKPADAADDDHTYLIKILNSTRGFPVRLIYATRGPAISGLGAVRSTLPRPEILVTHSRWHVFLPEGLSYGVAKTNMDVIKRLPRRGLHERPRMARPNDDTEGEHLRLDIPESGRHIAFEKLYANQDETPTWILVPYASGRGTMLGRVASSLCALLLWAGLIVAAKYPRARMKALALAGISLTLLLIPALRYGVSLVPAVGISIVLGVVLATIAVIRLRRRNP